MVAHLLSIDDLESLLHLATLCAPALFIRDQGYVGVFGDTVITCATVHTLAIIVITQVIIATTEASKIKIFKCPVSSSPLHLYRKSQEKMPLLFEMNELFQSLHGVSEPTFV